MPTSPLKRPNSGGGGRLGRLLASLRPPARAGPLPVQTGFPTSLADIVVKNHGRLRNSRRRHRTTGPPPAASAEPQQRRELSVAHDRDTAAQVPVPVPARPGKGSGFSIRPGLLVAGGAVALALLVIWSKQLVAAATLASVALSWIESVRSDRWRPETKEEMDLRGRGRVSPIREAAESPRPSCGECESDNGGSNAASLWSADDTSDLGCDDTSSSANSPKRKQSRRSLQKLLASKLRNGKRPRDKGSSNGGDAGEHEPPGAGEANAESAPSATAGAPARETTPATPPEAITDDDRCRRRRGRALPLPALVPIILAGLVAGKLPALALAVLCAAFSWTSSVERVPVPAGQASSR